MSLRSTITLSPVPGDTKPHRLHVALAERDYDIVVGQGLLAGAGAYIDDVLPQKRVIILTDDNVAQHHLPTLVQSLERHGIQHHHLIIPPGEASKSFATLELLLQHLLTLKPERKTTLIALGGGVIGDLTGFAASILLRGVPFIQIPTTLLAQVDSSVGGKTGINTPQGKNLIGSFYQPRLVLADVATLSTLPKRELLAGYAEVVKYGLINHEAFFSWLERQERALVDNAKPELLMTAVLESCEAKAAIVAKDEKEQDVRALLNLGHTFGHALEAETGFGDTLLHGEGVAIGMVMAFDLSVQLGLCDELDARRVKHHLALVGLPTSPLDIRKEWDIARLMAHFYQDKKVSDGALTFILTRGIGKAFISKDVDESELGELLAKTLKVT